MAYVGKESLKKSGYIWKEWIYIKVKVLVTQFCLTLCNPMDCLLSRLLRVPWTARRSNQSILKEISPGCSLEGLMLMLKLQYFVHLMWRTDSFEKKDPDAGKDWGQEEKGTTEDEMVEWHHWHNGHGFGWTLGVGDGQGGLACCGSWGRRESDTAERLNWTELNWGSSARGML